jgi:two-component system alkaline phosphatase synthesis response regulator PhoP
MHKKILIVDDENDILEFVSYNFKKYGYEVYTASNAKEGIEKAIQYIPDVIIADIRMPEVDGIEMCKRIKRNEIIKNIPVIFLTADSDEYLALSAHYAGGAQYINKPVYLKLLLNIVKEVLNEKNNIPNK